MVSLRAGESVNSVQYLSCKAADRKTVTPFWRLRQPLLCNGAAKRRTQQAHRLRSIDWRGAATPRPLNMFLFPLQLALTLSSFGWHGSRAHYPGGYYLKQRANEDRHACKLVRCVIAEENHSHDVDRHAKTN